MKKHGHETLWVVIIYTLGISFVFFQVCSTMKGLRDALCISA